MDNNVLKQAEAQIEVTGMISEMDLKVVQEENNEAIVGRIKILTDETNTVSVDVNSKKFTRDGNESKTYPGWVTRMKEYKSIADEGKEEATIVRITKKGGSLRPSKYINKETLKEVQGIRYAANFMNKVDREYDENGNLENEFKAEFHVEGYIQSIIDEFNNQGEETGRKILNLQVPTYNSIEPLKVIIPEDMVSDVESIWSMGDTVMVDGNIVSRSIVHEKVIKRAIGKDIVETSYDYVNELIMTGGTEPYEEAMAYSEESIRKALADKQVALDEARAKAEADKKSGNKNTSAVPKKTTATDRTLPRVNF